MATELSGCDRATSWPAKLKILATWLSTEKVTDLCSVPLVIKQYYFGERKRKKIAKVSILK